MVFNVEITSLANQDLEDILDYIGRELDNPSAASSFLSEVDTCYANLEKMPFMYNFCQNARLMALGYRKVVIKNYIMIYRVEETTHTVYILRFFYGRRDYEKLI